MTIPVYEGKMPSLTTDQLIEVDRAMMQDTRIELIQMMENAGRDPAHLARVRFFAGNPRRGKRERWRSRFLAVSTVESMYILSDTSIRCL